MSTPLEQVDVDWAWEPFTPSPSQPWTRQWAGHLHRRAAFGATSAQLEAAVRQGPEETVNQLFPGTTSAPSAERLAQFDEEGARLGRAMLGAGKTENLGAWWLYRMGKTPAPLVERMALFWHGHFATSAAKVEDVQLMLNQDALLHRHALGSFAELSLSMAQDPAMLIWLDSTSNRKRRPNENFARELMELFCLGPGHYSEEDIREMARCFTGWEVRQGQFAFNRYQHDAGTKSFLGRTGPFGGEDAVRIVLDQPASALFVVRKLSRFLVAEEPVLPDRLLAPLATQLREEDFQVSGVIRRILRSNLFYSEHAIGRRVRSPVELSIGLLRSLDATTDYVRLNQEVSRLGQAPFFPPNVKGWDGGRSWIHSATVLGRANLVARLAQGEETRFAAGSLSQTVNAAGVSGQEETVDWLLDLLVAVPVGQRARKAIRDAIGEVPVEQVAEASLRAIGWRPELQLS